jgi:hypothetical protein
MINEVVRVVSTMSQVKGTLILLSGGAYFYSEDWLKPLEALLGREMALSQLINELTTAIGNAHNPRFREISPELWARRISAPVRKDSTGTTR